MKNANEKKLSHIEDIDNSLFKKMSKSQNNFQKNKVRKS